MAPTFITAAVSILVVVLPMFGIKVATAELTTTIQTIVLILAPLFIIFRQKITGRANWFGGRPQDFVK